MKGEGLITKITPKANQFSPGSGGIQEITREDILTAFKYGKISYQAYIYALYVCCGDRSVGTRNALELHIKELAVSLFTNKGQRPKNVEAIVQAVADELTYPQVNHCPRCNGTGSKLNRKRQPIPCDLCHQTGGRRVSDREMGGRLGMDHKTAKHYRKHVKDVSSEVEYQWAGALARLAHTLTK
jgi:hypothetical protein